MSGPERIRIVEWSRTPGARKIDQGKYSGEAFRAEILDAAFERAVATNEKLVVDMDGTAGYLPSFVEETFGGLARKYGSDVVLRHLEIVYGQDEVTLKDAWEYVRDPKPEKRPRR